MKLYIGVTDNEWYRFLSQLSNVDEVNFWQPGGTNQFRALQPGELFLFKLKRPHNHIAGGGFFTHATRLPVSLAWEAFGEKNGATTFQEMRAMIADLRTDRVDPHEDFYIGCILLQYPFFLPKKEWIPVPQDFHRNLMKGKGFDTDSGSGKVLWDEIQLKLKSQPVLAGQVGDGTVMWGNPTLVRQRLGQGSFRILVTDTYRRQCAAHIRPVTEEGKHRVDNGLLFRSDIHRLFDKGYVTVTPDYKFRASRRLKDDFDNGEEYWKLDGNNIWLPKVSEAKPNREFLEWHSDTVFRR
jgi:putative restriction endonuclease